MLLKCQRQFLVSSKKKRLNRALLSQLLLSHVQVFDLSQTVKSADKNLNPLIGRMRKVFYVNYGIPVLALKTRLGVFATVFL